MSVEYSRLPTDFGDLVVRQYRPRDLEPHAAYVFDSPREFRESIGFNTAKMPDRDMWTANALARMEATMKGERPTTLVGELDGKTFAMMFYDSRLFARDGVAKLHFHIFSPENRGKGLGRVFFAAAASTFAQIYQTNRFLIEPKQTNVPMNALMRSLGYRHVKDYLLTEGSAYTQVMDVSQYEILFT